MSLIITANDMVLTPDKRDFILRLQQILEIKDNASRKILGDIKNEAIGRGYNTIEVFGVYVLDNNVLSFEFISHPCKSAISKQLMRFQYTDKTYKKLLT